MKVFFDIITNHTADVIDYAEGQYTYIDKATEPVPRRGTATRSTTATTPAATTFPPLDPAMSFPYTPVFRDAGRRRPSRCRPGSTTRRYYHNRGDSTFAGEYSEYGDFVGLDDLFTEQPDVVDGMTRHLPGVGRLRHRRLPHRHRQARQHGVLAAVRRGASPTQAAARRQRRLLRVRRGVRRQPGVHVAATRPRAGCRRRSTSASRPAPPASPTAGRRPSCATCSPATTTTPTPTPTPTRCRRSSATTTWAASALPRRQRRGSDDELLARDQLAHSLMYLSRGQPVVYYGDEQGFIGDGGDQDARQDMFPSQVASYNDDDLIGDRRHDGRRQLRPRPPAVPAIWPSSPRCGRATRRSPTAPRSTGTPAAAPGSTRSAASTPTSSASTSSRSTTATTADRRRSPRSRRGHVPRPVAGGAGADVRSDAEGRVTVTVPPLSAPSVWRATAAAPAVAPTRRRCTSARPGPGRHRRRPGRGRRAPCPADGFDQVTIAWRPAGTERVDGARHRRQRAVPRVPRRQRPRRRARSSSTAPCCATTSGNLVGRPDVRRPSATRRRRAAAGRAAAGRSTSPTPSACPGSLNTRDGLPGRLAARLRPGPADPRPQRPDLEGHATRPARRRLRVQGRHRRSVGRELRRRRASTAGRTSRSPIDGGPVTFYYDHAHALGHQRRAEPDHHRARQLPVRARLPGRLDAGLHAAVAAGPRRRRHVDLVAPPRSPPARYEVKVTHGLSWDENYGAGGAPGGAQHPVHGPGDGVRVTFSLRAGHPRADDHDLAGRRRLPTSTQPKAHWRRATCSRGTCRPSADGWRFRLCTPRRRAASRSTTRRSSAGRRTPLHARPGRPAGGRRGSSGRTSRPTTRCGCRTHGEAPLGRTAHRPARGRRLRRPRPARRRDRRADPRRARRPLRGRRRPQARRHVGAAAAAGRRCGRRRRKDVDLLVRRPGAAADDPRRAMRPRRRRRLVGRRPRDWNGASVPLRGRRLRARRRARSRPTSSPTRTRSR